MTEKYVKALKMYIEAWNNHDESALMSIFIEGGTYQDSATGVPLTEQAIEAYAKNLWAAFPDLSFEIGRSAIGPDGTAFAEWVMCGTNSGPFNGLPPTERKISLDGVDIFAFQGDRISSVRGFFNGNDLLHQLGLA